MKDPAQNELSGGAASPRAETMKRARQGGQKEASHARVCVCVCVCVCVSVSVCLSVCLSVWFVVSWPSSQRSQVIVVCEAG